MPFATVFLLLFSQFPCSLLAQYPIIYNCEQDDGPTIIQFSAPSFSPFGFLPIQPPPPYPPIGPAVPPPPPLPVAPPPLPYQFDAFGNPIPPPILPPPPLAYPPPFPYGMLPPGFTCTIISPSRRKRATSTNTNPYFEQFQDEYGVGKEKMGPSVKGGEAAARLKEYEPKFTDEYGVGKERLPVPNDGKNKPKGSKNGDGGNGQGKETNGNGSEKTVEATKTDRPMDRFAPWIIGRRMENVAA